MLDALPLPQPLESRIGTALLRRATVDDTDAVITLLADDPIQRGPRRWRPTRIVPRTHAGSSRSWQSRPNDLLVVELDGAIVGTLQLTSIPGMARRGAAATRRGRARAEAICARRASAPP